MPISYKEAEEEGIKVVEIACKRFHRSNVREYALYGMDLEDLIGYVHSTILVPRYLHNAVLTPDFYPSIKEYKASLFTASHKACLAHYRRIKAKKRADSFREGAIVQINQRDYNGELPQFEREILHRSPDTSYDVMVRMVADNLYQRGYNIAARIFLVMTYKGKCRNEIEAQLSSASEEEIEAAFLQIKSTLQNI